MRDTRDPELQRLLDRRAVTDAVNRLFIETDRKNWYAVAMLFADSVRFDMTSLAGGAPARMTGKEIAAAWQTGLAEVQAVHHQASNYLVDVEGDEATVYCYATATHYRPETDKALTTFVGAYDIHLVRGAGHWRIDAFRYESKYVV